MSRSQHILAVIVGLITGVLLMESYGAMVTAARAGGRAIPELWPLGTEALALAMEVSVLEAKRLGHRAVLRLSWLLLVASVALCTLLQVAVAPPTLVGYLTAGATPVWLLGSFAVLSLLYRADTSADPVAAAAEVSAERRQASAEVQQPGAGVLTKRARAERLCRTQRHRRGGQRWAAGRRCWAQRQLRPCPGRQVSRPTADRRPAQRSPPHRERGRRGPGGQVMTAVPPVGHAAACRTGTASSGRASQWKQLLVGVDDPHAALELCLGCEPASALSDRLDRASGRCGRDLCPAWHTPAVVPWTRGAGRCDVESIGAGT
jgi:hypothetical protein